MIFYHEIHEIDETNETGMDLFDYYCKNSYPEIRATTSEEFFASPSSGSHL